MATRLRILSALAGISLPAVVLALRNSRYEARPKVYYRLIGVGCGKTFLAYHYANHTQNFEKEVVLSYFFNSSDLRSATAVSLVASLIAQLCQDSRLATSTSFSYILEELFELSAVITTAATDCRLEQLLPFLGKILELLPLFTVVIDGVDECTDLETAGSLLLGYLRNLAGNGRARVILFSRHRALLQDILGDGFCIAIERDLVEVDVMLFVDREIKTKSWGPEVKDAVLTKISADGDGIFLWARLLLEGLEKRLGPPQRRALLASFPRGIFKAYSQEIETQRARLTTEELGFRADILQVVFAAIAPMTAYINRNKPRP